MFYISVIIICVISILLYITIYRGIAKKSNCDWILFSAAIIVFQLILCRPFVLRQKSGISEYDLIIFSSSAAKKTIECGVLISLFACLVYLFICLIYKRKKFLWGKSLPYSSIKCLFVTLASLVSILAIVDSCMTQYAAWNLENAIRNNDGKKSERTIAYGSGDYPLIWNSSIDSLGESGKHRILVLGDSFIWGDGSINSNNLWWSQLGKIIHQRGYNDCEVIAVGKSGASTQDQLNWVRNSSMLDDINPDLVIIGYVTNDPAIELDDGELECKQYNPPRADDSIIRRNIQRLYPNISSIVSSKLESKRNSKMQFSDETGYPYEQWELEIISPERLAVYQREIVEPLAEELEERSIPAILVTTPNTPYLSYEERYKDVLPIFSDAGIDVYNSLYEFIDEYSLESEEYLRINPVNGHPGTASNMFYAKYVAEVLEHNYANVLGDKSECIFEEMVVNDYMPREIKATMSDSKISIEYPAENTNMPFMPVKQPFVKVCFENPIDIDCIRLQSESLNLGNAIIWVTRIDSILGYDTEKMEQLKVKDGCWVCEYEGITSICIHVENSGKPGDIDILFD